MACMTTIDFSMQIDGDFVLLPTTELTVCSSSAEDMGLHDEVDEVRFASVLDAVVDAHKLVLGDEFEGEGRNELLQMRSDQWLARAFGKPAFYSGFAINGEYACDPKSPYGKGGYRGLAFNQASISEGDTVECFVFQDSYGMDYYTYFLRDGLPIRSAELAAGQSVHLVLEGLMFGYGGPLKPPDRVKHRFVSTAAGSQLVIVDVDTGEEQLIEGAITGKDGGVDLAFDQPGHYYVSARGGSCRYNSRLTRPWLEIDVRA